jgi:hypothetical protein
MSASGSTTELLIHRRLAESTAKAVAEAIDSDETHISKFRSGERGLKINQIGPALAAMGLKLVDSDETFIHPKRLAALECLAGESLGALK